MRRKLAPKSCAFPGATLSQEPELRRASSASSCSMRSSSVISWGSACRARPRPRPFVLFVSALMPCASTPSWDSTISRYVVDVSRSSSCVPMPTMPPSSSTTMRSASVMVETRCATTILVTCGNSRHNACLSLASVVRSSAENESSNTRMSGLCTIARAIASRWRWPPDTLVPPWAMRAFSPPSMSATKSRPCAISSACQSSASVASSRPNRRLEATVPAKRKGRCGTRPIVFHSWSRSASRTSTPLTRTEPPVDVEQARDERDERGLAGAGRADDRDGLAGLGPERDALEHGVLGAGVGELDIAELDRCRPRGTSPTGFVGARERRLAREHLADALGRHGRARDHDRRERGHEHAAEDQADVLHEGEQRADLARCRR